MKKLFKFSILSIASCLAFSMVSCSDDDNNSGAPDDSVNTVSVGFSNVPSQYFGNDEYGTNLYYGTQGQITTGYLAELDYGKYAQFSINYGKTYDADFNSVWGYSFYQGGLALSDQHNMTIDTYLNQLSVYNTTSPSGGNFVVAFGLSDITNPSVSKYSDYSECAKLYITDAQGYYVKEPGAENSSVTGESESAWFKSVMINNTTYDYLTMKNGNNYAKALNEENKGWFKVQFIAFADDDPNDSPLGYVEAYLASFDPQLTGEITGIMSDWTKVDLSSLPEASILVINFVGSDTGEYGLNTPSYCALDQFVISVED